MLSIDECKKHLRETNLSDQEIEKIRDLLHAFVERTLDYVVENGMLVIANQPCEPHESKENRKQ